MTTTEDEMGRLRERVVDKTFEQHGRLILHELRKSRMGETTVEDFLLKVKQLEEASERLVTAEIRKRADRLETQAKMGGSEMVSDGGDMVPMP